MNPKYITILTLSLLLSLSVFSQKRTIRKANEAFAGGEYHKAAELYEKIFEKLSSKEQKADISYKLGECNRIMMQDKKAKKWYKKAVRYKTEHPLAYLYYADALRMAEEYEKASELYKKYGNLVPADPRGSNGIKSCELAPAWLKNPTRYIIRKEDDINSKSADFSPSFGKSKSEIYFTSNRESAGGKEKSNITGRNFSGIFIAQKDRKGKWGTPTTAEGSINTDGSEGAGVVLQNGSVMYFTKCHKEDGANLGCKIYKSKNNAGGWSDPQREKIIGDSSVSVAHPAVSQDELTMYFVSDSIPGAKSRGGYDIWVMHRDSPNAAWSKPQNLGSKINTPGNEKFPFLTPDGTLYFASDGHPGMGGYDIFKATPSGNSWIVENMKSPINSPQNDFSICFYENQAYGYFASDRERKINLYVFKLPKMHFALKGIVKNSDTGDPLPDAKVKLTSPSGDELEINSAKDGRFQFGLKGNRDYSIVASKSKFLSAVVDRSTKGLKKSKTFSVTLELSPIQTTIQLPNIEYDLAKTSLRPESMVSLDELVKTLELNPNITIELAANTDFRGGDDYNQKLSEGRAESVIKYLISRGIKADRLTPVGNGEKKPRKINDLTKTGRKILSSYHKFIKNGDVLSEEFINQLPNEEQKEICHQLNRRTEFRVLRDDYGINAQEFGTEKDTKDKKK
ncbi:MAG: hypothetical protein CSB06_03265 [Bacteroidia bacterium]|nr:MAG: hypothetical protein CSB06_03265 [Bacteroidia bacterium]